MKTTTPESNEAPPKRALIMGYSPTSVLRWMGADGWSEADAGRVLVHFGLELSPATIGLQVKAGRTRKQAYGVPAPVTPEQANELCEILENL